MIKTQLKNCINKNIKTIKFMLEKYSKYIGDGKEHIETFVDDINTNNNMYENLLGDNKPKEITCIEQEVLDAFLSIPTVFFIKSISVELKKVYIQKTASYYLFNILNNANNLYSPFVKSDYSYKLSNEKPAFNYMSTDATAIKNQKGCILLFNALDYFCYEVFPDTYESELAEFAFELNRGYVPHKRYIGGKGFDYKETSIRQYKLQFEIEQSLRYNFTYDVMSFQQYAKIQCNIEDFYKFYFNGSGIEKRVIKELKHIITDEIVEDYCKNFIYKSSGYGTSAQSEQWNKEMSKFLDSIIFDNQYLSDYIRGVDVDEADINVADEITLDSFANAFTYINGNKPERIEFMDRCGKLQLAIHYICLEKAADIARIQAMEIFKKVFFS